MKRKPRNWPADAAEWTPEFIEAERNKPINRATEKLTQFVNACVADPDFRESPALLDLLIILRDELAEEATEEWCLNEYLEPIVSKLKSRSAKAKNADLRRRCQREWLERSRKNPKLKKCNFAAEFKAMHGKAPEVKQIADDWLSPKKLEEVKKTLYPGC